jgi:hypothetical protein
VSLCRFFVRRFSHFGTDAQLNICEGISLQNLRETTTAEGWVQYRGWIRSVDDFKLAPGDEIGQ